ncbi:hypothetical protein ADN00_18340 [Ornatilinea apprima]|uniref:Glycosyl transferase family 1 domain-containing protein n=1 Tax=Ornatilinea apprima TaxID=1134406 RepID=A0A0P6WK30_9CHLR|nr:glycosyltransferase family 4 protein [Ornatilinea apprima]KPL70024.1 hypothetical protein ADN00_18340 [Ornatilinea apprima]
MSNVKINKPSIAILTTYIAPYRVSLFEELQKRVGKLRIFISTKMEPNRRWGIDWGRLDVVVQNTITIPKKWKHPHGFIETTYTQIPMDTLSLLIDYQPDVIVSVEFGLRTLFSVFYKIFHWRCKLIIWAAISSVTEKGRSRFRVLVRKILLQFCDGVYVNGKSGRAYLNSLGMDDQRIFDAPYATDVDVFKDISIFRTQENAYRLLFIGQLIERKGLSYLLRGLSCWLEKNQNKRIEMWIAGYGNQAGLLESENKAPNFEIKLLGEVPYDRLAEIYCQCGALVFPTLADEWGMVVNEAMASGCIVLGSLYSQAVEEMVVEGQNGWAFHPENTDEIENVLDKFFSKSVEQLNEMRVNAKARSLEYSPDKIADMMNIAIQSVLCVDNDEK